MKNRIAKRMFVLINGCLGFLFSLLCIVQFSNLSFAGQPLDITSSTKYAALVVDSNSGRVLFSKNAHKLRHPASLAKTMSLFLTFEALESGKLTMAQKLFITERAAMQPRSKLGLKAGEKITVRECIYALIVKSANDAAVVLAEAIGGSEGRFVQLMNKRAKELGMSKTNFVNSHGWHDPRQVSTAVDIAKLSLALIHHHPKYYPMFSKTTFYYKNKIIKGHNHVMSRYYGAEGLKTGYVRASGYNLITTATRPQGRLIAVVFGGQTAKVRDDHMIELLNHGFTLLAQKQHPKSTKVASSAYHVLNNQEQSPKQNVLPSNGDIFSIIDQPRETKVANLEKSRVPKEAARKTIYKTNSLKHQATKSYLYKQKRKKSNKSVIRSTSNNK